MQKASSAEAKCSAQHIIFASYNQPILTLISGLLISVQLDSRYLSELKQNTGQTHKFQKNPKKQQHIHKTQTTSDFTGQCEDSVIFHLSFFFFFIFLSYFTFLIFLSFSSPFFIILAKPVEISSTNPNFGRFDRNQFYSNKSDTKVSLYGQNKEIVNKTLFYQYWSA